MIRVETEAFEVVDAGRRTRYSTVDQARANCGPGAQIRRRVDSVDVRAEFVVRLNGVEVSRHEQARDATQASKQHTGATVHMVPAVEQPPTPS